MKNDPPPKGKRRCKGRHASDPKGVTPSQHVREFPNKSFSVSSAAAERVFSLLKACFSDQHDSCLQDYVQASLMMQYNKR